MTYAATYRIGHDKQGRAAKATRVAPAIRGVRRVDAKTKRRIRDKEGQTEIRTGGDVAPAFLRTTFLPKLEVKQRIQACTENENMERDFYTSLSLMAEHYSISPLQTKHYGYPYNIALALWDAEKKLKQACGNWDELELVKDGKKTFLMTEERCRTGCTLYYIPVLPLFELLHDPVRKKAAHLLLSVFSYLYHIADIPYYRQEDSYLHWQYVLIDEWVAMDEEHEETEAYQRELSIARWVGDRMEQRIFNRSNLSVFEQRLTTFKPRTEFDKECHRLASTVYTLCRNYPNASIFRNIRRGIESDGEDDDYRGETISIEKYISFAASTKGWLYENIEDTVNNEFNELGSLEEPTIIKSFNGRPLTDNNLDFERRLFMLIDDLCDLLNNYKTNR